MDKIPIYQPYIAGNEKRYVLDCLDSNWISSKGIYVEKFQQAFAEFTGVKYALGVCNGTVALHLALVALGIRDGDEVIVPTLTYIASVNSITYTGATPIFVDSTAEDWQMNPNQVKAAITPRTKAILAVHLYGHPCNILALKNIAREHNLFLVEDCAEALGSLYMNQHVGSFGDISTFSFYGNKTITTGEGGMVITNNSTLYDRACRLRGQGLAKYREYWHDIVGYNYRMTNVCAAIGLAQMEKINHILQLKRSVFEVYSRLLMNTPLTLHSESSDVYHSYWMVSILVPFAKIRDQVREYLAGCGIETRPVFYPVHSMPMFSERYQVHPVAEDIASRGINLPSFPELTDEQLGYICNCLMSSLSKYL